MKKYKEKLKNLKEDVSDRIFDDARKMFYQGLDKETIITRLKDKYPEVSIVHIRDIVDRVFEYLSREDEYNGYKEKLKRLKESTGKFSTDASDVFEAIVTTNKTKTPDEILGIIKSDSFLNDEIIELGISDEELKKYIVDTKQMYRLENLKNLKKEYLEEQIIALMIQQGKSDEEIFDELKYSKLPKDILQDSIDFYRRKTAKTGSPFTLEKVRKKEGIDSIIGTQYYTHGEAQKIIDMNGLTDVLVVRKEEKPVWFNDDWKQVYTIVKKESYNKKEGALTLDDVAIEKYNKEYNKLTPEEKKEVNYIYSEWTDDEEDIFLEKKKYKEGLKQIVVPKIMSDDEVERYCELNDCTLITVMRNHAENKTTLMVNSYLENYKEKLKKLKENWYIGDNYPTLEDAEKHLQFYKNMQGVVEVKIEKEPSGMNLGKADYLYDIIIN